MLQNTAENISSDNIDLKERITRRERMSHAKESLKSAYHFFGISLMMLGVVVMAVAFLFNQSLRLDEAQSLWQTSRTPAAIFTIVAHDVHVPLYHMLLHYWQLFFGSQVDIARTLSLVFFVFTIPAVYMLGKESYGKKVALFGALLVAISPFLNWYGSEARMYSLMVFITVLNQYFFVKLFKHQVNQISAATWWGYFITAFFGMYTHYFFMFVLLAQFVFFVGNQKLFPVKAKRNFAIIWSMLALMFAPWALFVLRSGLAATTQPHLSTPSTVDLFNTFSQFFFGFQNDHLNTILVSLWPVSIVFAIFGLRRERRGGERRKVPSHTIYFLTATILPIAMVFFVSLLLKPIYLTRYLIFTIPSMYLFLGWIISTFPKAVGNFVRVLLVLAMLGTLANQTISAQTPVKENYKQAVDYVSSHATEQDVVITVPPFTIYPVEYYYHGSMELATLPIWNQYNSGGLPAFNSNTLPDQVNKLKSDHQNAWVILSQDQGYNDQVRLYFDTHFQRLDHQDFSDGLSLYEYKLRYDK